jgi:glycosyltransferase involved in cell wall biosynthesis
MSIKKLNKNVQLVVSGKMSGQLKNNAFSIFENNFPDIIFTGFTERYELEALYRSATATLFLSSFEGFGFPVLEAMSNGCPVIATNVTSIPEVAGDAAILCDLHDINAVATTMVSLLENPDIASKLKKAGYQQSGGFSWQATAIKTVRIWESMLVTPLLKNAEEPS